MDADGKPKIDIHESQELYRRQQEQRRMERAIRKTKRELLMKKAEIDKESVMRYEEILSKLVTYNVSKWKDMDIPGNVAWVA